MRHPTRTFHFLPSLAVLVALTGGCSTDDAVADGDGGQAPGTSTGDEVPAQSTSSDAAASSDDTAEPPSETTTGEPPSETTTGESSDDGTSSGGSSEESGTGEESSTGEEPPPVEAPPWMVSLDRVGGQLHVKQIDIETAAQVDACTVTNASTGAPVTLLAYSSTFTRDDRLFFSSGDQLWEVALPACEATLVGGMAGYDSVFGISPDEANGLFGIDANEDELLRIDPDTGVVMTMGPLGADWYTLGITRDELTGELIGLDGYTDALYELDPATGSTTWLQDLRHDFFQIAFEYHSGSDRIYACSEDTHLRRLELDGSLTDLGGLGFAEGCLNFAAPWSDAAGLPPMP